MIQRQLDKKIVNTAVAKENVTDIKRGIIVVVFFLNIGP